MVALLSVGAVWFSKSNQVSRQEGTTVKRKMTALACCLAMAFGGLAVTALPASAHHEQSCYYTYVPQQVQIGTRMEQRVFTGYGGMGTYIMEVPVPIYTTVWGQVPVCTTISHPVEPAPEPEDSNWVKDTLSWIGDKYCTSADYGYPNSVTQAVVC